MKTSELIKLGIGDSFILNQPEGPQSCTITAIRRDEQWLLIDFDGRDGRPAMIHAALAGAETEELGAINPVP